MLMKNITKFSHLNKTMVVLSTALSFSVCLIAFADGATRKATQTEKDFSKAVLATFAKVIPAAPGGWYKSPDSTEVTDLQNVTVGENQPLQLDYHIAWEDTKRIKEAQAQQEQELLKLFKRPGVTQKEIEKLQEKMAPHDVQVMIDLYTNFPSQAFYHNVTILPAIAGGLVCQTQGEYRKSNGWYEGYTYVFLGKTWKREDNSTSTANFIFKPEKKITSTTVVQNIIVRIQATPARSRQIIEKIDWDALKKLIKN
jgi:hypothetical protein